MRKAKAAVAARRRGLFQRITTIPKSPTRAGPKVPCCQEAAAWVIVVIVAVAVDDPLPGRAIDSGCITHVGSAGDTEHVRSMLAVEPFCGVSNIWKIAFCPAIMVFVFGVVAIVNAGRELTTRVNGLDMLVANSESPL